MESPLRRRLARAAIVTLSLLAVAPLAACDGDGKLSIRSLHPAEGRVQGDERVTLGGRNFRTDIGYTVYFGPNRSRRVAVVDPDTLVAFTPRADGPGAVDVAIRGEDGTALVIRNGYVYQEQGSAAPAAPAAEQGEAPGLVY